MDHTFEFCKANIIIIVKILINSYLSILQSLIYSPFINQNLLSRVYSINSIKCCVQGFVMSKVCYVQSLLCLGSVMSRVCYVQCLFCLVFVLYRVCYVYCWSFQGLFVYGWLWQPYTLNKVNDFSEHIDEFQVL